MVVGEGAAEEGVRKGVVRAVGVGTLSLRTRGWRRPDAVLVVC